MLCGKSRHVVSPGFGKAVRDYLYTLSVVAVYITDLVLYRFTQPV